jgi:deazaflavin-dependent oxidoreductase (nitroreductase family)
VGPAHRLSAAITCPELLGLARQSAARWHRHSSLHYVDPHKKHSRWYTAINNFGRSRPGQFLAHHFWPRIDPWLYRATGGRWPWILGGVSTAPLMTTGAKSGQPREHQITYFHDGPDPIMTASNYGGPKHPQWYYNLKAHPECELGGEKFLATEVTDLDDYARVLWACGAGLRRLERLSPEDRPDWPSYPRLSAQTALAATSTVTPRPPTARPVLEDTPPRLPV